MDLWDLGVLIANRAYQQGRRRILRVRCGVVARWAEFYKSREIIAEAFRSRFAAVRVAFGVVFRRFCSREAELVPSDRIQRPWAFKRIVSLKLEDIMAEGGDAPQHIQLKVRGPGCSYMPGKPMVYGLSPI